MQYDTTSLDIMSVLVIGSTNIDTFIYADRLPSRGETVAGSRTKISFGGKGANQAVMSANMGVSTCMMACIGMDRNGELTMQHLRDKKIDVSVIEHIFHQPTGTAYILVDESSGENEIVVIPGANSAMTAVLVDKAADHISNARVVSLQCEIPMESVLRAMSIVSRYNPRCLVVFNPSPIPTSLPPQVFAETDILVLNEFEAQTISGYKLNALDVNSLGECARILLAKGVRKSVVLTLGANGSFLAYKCSRDSNTPTIYQNETDGVLEKHIPDQSTNGIPVVDTTGAGDAYSGVMCAMLARGAHIEDACVLANRIASITVTRRGCQESYPEFNDIEVDIRGCISQAGILPSGDQFVYRQAKWGSL
jgi:ribokinase